MSGLDWVEWHGGPLLPDIAPRRLFWVKRRHGGCDDYLNRSDVYWGHVGGPSDVVAYALDEDLEPVPAKLEKHLAFNRKVNEAKPSKVKELKARVSALEDRVKALEAKLWDHAANMAVEDPPQATEKPADGREWRVSADLYKVIFGRPGPFLLRGIRK